MSKIFDILTALETALSVIAVDNGYNTDIGSKIFLYDAQRSKTQRPSIAISVPAGKIDRTDESSPVGRKLSRSARQVDFNLEAGLSVSSADAQRVAMDALDDIERVYATLLANKQLMPRGVVRVSLSTWSITDRPDGIDAVVLQVAGFAEYTRDIT